MVSPAGPGTGPRKIVLADHDLPHLDALLQDVAANHAVGRPVAVHCVSSAALAMTIAALNEVGALPGDRVEHAAVCDDHAARRLARLGVVVATQPSIYRQHGAAFRRGTPPEERRSLWRYGSLLEEGVSVVASSDAPYGHAGPWRMIGRRGLPRASDAQSCARARLATARADGPRRTPSTRKTRHKRRAVPVSPTYRQGAGRRCARQ